MTYQNKILQGYVEYMKILIDLFDSWVLLKKRDAKHDNHMNQIGWVLFQSKLF